MSSKHLIIGGTEKAGTTSVFGYLSGHPEVRCSKKKETDFFRQQAQELTTADLTHYWSFFDDDNSRCTLEASPGYLVDSHYSAKAIKTLLPTARLIFILRDPISRLLSSFSFHKTRLLLPEALLFDDYISQCLAYERGELSPQQAVIGEWFLRVLNAGSYYAHLSDYYQHFPEQQLRVYAFDQLNKDPLSVMVDVCQFADISASYFDGFEFYRANATFGARTKWLHRLALWVNSSLESFFITFPSVKQTLLALYKNVNGATVSTPMMSAETKQALVAYYKPDLLQLMTLPGCEKIPVQAWLAKYE